MVSGRSRGTLKVEEKILTVKAYTVPESKVLFRVIKNGEPVAGATVERIQQTSVFAGVETPILSPIRNVKTTDENGEVLYIHEAEYDKDKWTVIAYIPNTGFGFLKSEWIMTHGTAYDLKLKEYTAPPKMFVEFKLRDVIGADQYGAVLGAVEKWNLEHAGFTNVKVLGKGTKTVKVEFTPPWGEASLLWVDFTATTKGIIALVLVVVILGILFIMAWKFGEKIERAGLGLGILAAVLLLLKPKPKRRK